MRKPIILRPVSKTAAKVYCPQCKKYIAELTDESKATFPAECPHCQEAISVTYVRLSSKDEGLIDQ